MSKHGPFGVHRLADGFRCRLETMSLCTAGVAVAVQAMKGTSGRADRRSPISRYCIASIALSGVTGHSKPLLDSQTCHDTRVAEPVSRVRGCCRRCHSYAPAAYPVSDRVLLKVPCLQSDQLIAAAASNVHQP